MRPQFFLLLTLALLIPFSNTARSETVYCNNNPLMKPIDAYKLCGVNANAICDAEVGVNSRGSKAYMSCIEDKKECHRQIREENKKIEINNKLYWECKRAFDQSKTENKWKSKIGAAQTRNQAMSGTKAENDQAYEDAVKKRYRETNKVWESHAAELERQRQAAKQSASKRQQQGNLARNSRAGRCGPDPYSNCGSASNPCQWSAVVRWNRCMGNPGY